MTVSDKTLTLRKIYEYANERGASELGKCLAFSHSKIVISFNILLVLLILYLRNIYIFRSQTTICKILHDTYNYQCSSLLFLMVWRYNTKDTFTTVYRQNTAIEKIYEYASEHGASELGKCLHFHILKLAISFNILLVLLILYLRNIYIFRSQITICMIHISSMQFPVLTYGMALYIQTTVYRQNTDIEKIYASERSERA